MTGCVYRIQHKTDLNLMTYIGSTLNFSVRRVAHKSRCNNNNNNNGYNIPLYQYIREHGGWQNWEMIEIYHGDNYLKMEQDLIKENFDNLLNNVIPGRTKAEYHVDNREHLIEKCKQWVKDNKEHRSQWQKEKVPCPHCDRFITRSNLAAHQRTQYCINYVAPESESPSSSSDASETA